MKIVLMEHETDCEVAALATACQVKYDDAETALMWRKLPMNLNNPVFGNPINLYAALLRLGFWKKNITLTDMLEEKAKPCATVVLCHSPEAPTMQQHWCVWAGKAEGKHRLFWGTRPDAITVSESAFKAMFTRGYPNCAFTVYKANIFTLLFNRFKMWWGKLCAK